MSHIDKTNGVPPDFIEGLKEVIDNLQGKKQLRTDLIGVPQQNPRAIREDLGMSQAEFAERFSIPRSTIQNWEQQRRSPDQAACAYLYVIKSQPEMVGECIEEMHREASATIEEESASD